MKHDGVPSLGFWEEGEGTGGGGWGGLRMESTPCEVGVVRLDVKLQDEEDVVGPVGVNVQSLGLGLEVDVSLRGAEGGEGSSLEEDKGHGQITLSAELKPFDYCRKFIGSYLVD